MPNKLSTDRIQVGDRVRRIKRTQYTSQGKVIALSPDGSKAQVKWARNTYWLKVEYLKVQPTPPTELSLEEAEISILEAARDNIFADITEGDRVWVDAVIDESGLDREVAQAAIVRLVERCILRVLVEDGANVLELAKLDLGSLDIFNKKNPSCADSDLQ